MTIRQAAYRPRLYTIGFISLCVVTLLGFSQHALLTGILPVYILELGGDATMVGLIIAVFSFPSIVLRPFIGRWADERGIHLVWMIGVAGLAVAGFLYLIPSVVALFVVRLIHGSSWATFNTGGYSTLGRSAPVTRRGEATGIFNLMPSIALFIFPGTGLLLVHLFGFQVPFALAGVLALLALAVTRFGPVPIERPTVSASSSGQPRQALLERSAMLPMLIEFLFTSSLPLFLTFMPVFAVVKGIPIPELAWFYPIFGGVYVAGRFALTPFADRLGRRFLLVFSVCMAMIGLSICLFANDLTIVTLGGAIYALGASQEPPTSMALAIDRSHPHRMGATMATYTLGFQLAHGIGAAMFGVVIDVFGFPAPFAVALATQILLLAVISASWRSLDIRRHAVAAGPT